MATFNDLRSVLRDENATAALVRYYERGWDRILTLLALGVSRPGAKQTRQLLAKLRAILATLNPGRDSFVRHWVRQWIRDAFFTGETAALGTVKQGKKKASTGMAVATVTNAIASLDQKLAFVAAQMDAAVTAAVLATHRAILADSLLAGAVVGGVLRAPAGLRVAEDLQRVVLEGPDAVTTARLRRAGIPRTVVESLSTLNRGIITVGKASVNAEAYVRTSAQDALGQAHNAAAVEVGRVNEIAHVFIDKEASARICPFCATVEFNVFYAGPLEKDPAGFPSLRDLPGGPPWHNNCVHVTVPWDIRDKSTDEIADALASARAIPSEFFGDGAVARVNHGILRSNLRKQA